MEGRIVFYEIKKFNMKKNKVFIIAEAGVNHNGSLKNAFKLVDLAANAGADAVKFQTFNVSKLLTERAKLCNYQKFNNKILKQYDLLKPLELEYDEFIKIARYCKHKNIEFMSTAFDVESLEFLKTKTKIKRIKVSSGEIINPFLLLSASRSGLPIILSTGVSNIKEIKLALSIILFGFSNKNNKKYPSKSDLKKSLNLNNEYINSIKKKITILHCISEYPAPASKTNLNAMIKIGKEFSLPYGLSDHSIQKEVPIAAAAMGANVIEKHLTLNKNMKGPDHKASLSFNEFREMVENIRKIESILGNGIKKPSSSELKNKKFIRGSLVASKKICKGEKFSWNNITVKRPGDGLSPSELFNIVGKKSKYNFFLNDQIKK